MRDHFRSGRYAEGAIAGIETVLITYQTDPDEILRFAAWLGVGAVQLHGKESPAAVASFVKRAEACGCSAIVLTLDTTMLGWRPRDLDLGSLPFMQGQGIAQYTSDPVFRSLLAQPLDLGPAPQPPLNLQTIATALEQKANYPGGLMKNLTSGDPRAAVQRRVPGVDGGRLSTAEAAARAGSSTLRLKAVLPANP